MQNARVKYLLLLKRGGQREGEKDQRDAQEMYVEKKMRLSVKISRI